MNSTRAERGFTLIEIVVAIAILGIGVVVIIELFGGGLRLERTSEEYTKAVGYARMKMEEISFVPSLEEGIQEGEFDRDYRWQVEVRKVDLIPSRGIETSYRPPVELYYVRIEVLWKSGFKERKTWVESYRAFKSEASEKTS
jgi:prepilin-type N-terminal cleavage/methylation domain-containing protein